MRAFIGIALPEGVREAVSSLEQELAKADADVKWVAAQNLHITLKFLDEITPEQCQEIEAVLKEAAGGIVSFDMGLDRVGAFPSLGSPRVVWVGVATGREELEKLAEAIEKRTEDMGLRGEGRPFSAHLTVGRVRSSRNRKALADLLRSIQWEAPAGWKVGEVILYQSVLSPKGPRYTVLANVPLGAAS